MNAVAAIVADVGKQSGGKLTLNVKAPLLGVRRLIVDRHSRLDGKWGSGRDGGSCADRVRHSTTIDVEVGEEALAQAHVELGIAELQTVVIEHAVAGADGSRAFAERIPGDAETGRDGAIEFLANFAAEGRLGANEAVEGRGIGVDEFVQRAEVRVAHAAGRETVDQLYIHGPGGGNARCFRPILKRGVEVDKP